MPTSILDLWTQETPATIGISYLVMIVKEMASLYLWGMVFLIVERLRPAEPQTPFLKRDFKTEVCYPLFNAVVSTPVFTFLVLALTVGVLEPYAPYHLFGAKVAAWPYALQVFFALLIADVAVYVEHRFAHRFIGDFHAMHHMAKEVTWLTWARVHPVNVITIGLVAIIARFVVGFDGHAVLTAGWISAALAIWEHANFDFKLPKPLCYLIVTPHYHRWHHANEVGAIDKNFCLIFPFLDLLMGTYYCPDRKPSGYGLSSGADPVNARRLPDTFSGQIVYPFKRIPEHVRQFARGLHRTDGGVQSDRHQILQDH